MMHRLFSTVSEPVFPVVLLALSVACGPFDRKNPEKPERNDAGSCTTDCDQKGDDAGHRDPDGGSAQDGGNDPEDGGEPFLGCRRPRDCAEAFGGDAFSWVCTPSGECLPVCEEQADCQNGLVCEDNLCVEPGCTLDSDCAGDDVCQQGACVPPEPASSVASCVVQPRYVLLRQGESASFFVDTFAAGGAPVVHRGAVAWSSTQSASASVDTRGVAVGGAQAGAALVSAKVGEVACDAAEVTNLPSVPDKLRVVVVAANTGRPVQAAVSVDADAWSTTDINGQVRFDATAGAHSVSVTADGYTDVVFTATSARDLRVALEPVANGSGWTGSLTSDAFADKHDPVGTLMMAVVGGPQSLDPLELHARGLFGSSVQRMVDLGGQSLETTFPTGAVMGLGAQLWKSDFNIAARKRQRHLWTLGGNSEYSRYVSVIGPAVGDEEPVAVGFDHLQFLGRHGQVRLNPAALVDWRHEPAVVELGPALRTRLMVELPKVPEHPVTGEALPGVMLIAGASDGVGGLAVVGVTGASSGGRDEVLLRLQGQVEGLRGPPSLFAIASTEAPAFLGPSASEHGGQSGIAVPLDALAYSPTPTPLALGRGFPELPRASREGLEVVVQSHPADADALRLDLGPRGAVHASFWFPAVGSSFSFEIPTGHGFPQPPEGRLWQETEMRLHALVLRQGVTLDTLAAWGATSSSFAGVEAWSTLELPVVTCDRDNDCPGETRCDLPGGFCR